MATLPLKQALEQAKANPDSQFATSLRTMIETGKLDDAAVKQGVDLTVYGRPAPEPTQPNVIERVKTGILDRGQKVDAQISGTGEFAGKGAVERGVGAAATVAGGLTETAYNALPQPLRNTLDKVAGGIGKGFGFAVDKLSRTPLFEGAVAGNPEDTAKLESALKVASDLGLIAGEALGVEGGIKGAQAIDKGIVAGAKSVAKGAENINKSLENISNIANSTTKAITDTSSDILKDISPQQLSERNFAKAFKLAPGDVVELDSIAKAPVSEWAVSNNLIKGTGEETVQEIIKFKLKNYNAVRDAVDSVDSRFSFKDVPEAENIIDNLIKKTEGFKSQKYSNLNSQLKTISEKLNSNSASLSDIQFVKSAFDDIESIFKRSGSGGSEFKEGLRFQDLGESRSQVQKFIEDRVSEKLPGVDIKELNRNVRVSRGLVDDIAKRAGKFDTQSSASLGDYFVFGLGQQVAPGFGPAVFGIKKIVESSPIRLRLTKILSQGKKAPKATDIKAIQKAIADEIEAQLDIKI